MEEFETFKALLSKRKMREERNSEDDDTVEVPVIDESLKRKREDEMNAVLGLSHLIEADRIEKQVDFAQRAKTGYIQDAPSPQMIANLKNQVIPFVQIK